MAEQYEGVLVTVKNVEVGDPTTDSKQKVLGFKLAGSGLYIEADLHDFVTPAPPAKGKKFKSITGVLQLLLVRQLQDPAAVWGGFGGVGSR